MVRVKRGNVARKSRKKILYLCVITWGEKKRSFTSPAFPRLTPNLGKYRTGAKTHPFHGPPEPTLAQASTKA